MALSDKELYEYAEKMLSFEKDGVIDEEGLKVFADATDLVLSDEDKARMLNLANEIRKGKEDDQDSEEVAYETTTEDTQSEGIPF